MINTMELELGLALPDHSPIMIKGLDLNSCSNEMEIEKRKKGDCEKYNRHRNSTCDEEVEGKRLSLVLWSGQPDDGDQPRRWRNHHVDDDEEDEETLMGWPPINWLRRELLLHRHRGGGAAAGGRIIRNSMYVKVKMEGVAIVRKIDLRIYNSYQAFTHSLINMFAKCADIENDKSSGWNYTISYQDKEGDWMIVGDVPWETFVESVKRIEILRNAN